MVLWRISNHASLAGEGGLRASARWHTRGHPVVYCTESPSAALLEVLVHLEVDVHDLPGRYRLLKILAPDDLPVQDLPFRDLPTDWIGRSDITRRLGDRWLDDGRSALLRVPSAIVPETCNVLLNPRHPGAARITITDVGEHPLDPRLLHTARQ